MKTFGAAAAIIVVCVVGIPLRPASAISAEFAKKCRAFAFKAYPPLRVGSKSGNDAQMRGYYSNCLSKNGDVPEPTPAPSKKIAPAKP